MPSPPRLAAGLALIVASCARPAAPGLGREQTYPSHREVEVRWESGRAVLAGTLYLPSEPGPYPAIVFHFGSTPWTRAGYDGTGIPSWIAHGIAVLSYDKRGVGESQGRCCDVHDPDYLPLLANDLVTAVRMVRTHPDVDSARVGLFGFSQGGWIVPTASARAPGEIAFTVIGSGPAVPLSEEILYSHLTGDDQCTPTGLPADSIERALDAAPPSGFDPEPYLGADDAPGLWVYGSLDTSIPVTRSIANLERIKADFAKDFTIVVLPVNHEWIVNGAMCQSDGPTIDPDVLFDWLAPRISGAS